MNNDFCAKKGESTPLDPNRIPGEVARNINRHKTQKKTTCKDPSFEYTFDPTKCYEDSTKQIIPPPSKKDCWVFSCPSGDIAIEKKTGTTILDIFKQIAPTLNVKRFTVSTPASNPIIGSPQKMVLFDAFIDTTNYDWAINSMYPSQFANLIIDQIIQFSYYLIDRDPEMIGVDITVELIEMKVSLN